MSLNQHSPRKSLGQHFLHQKSVVTQIINHFSPSAEDTVVEIGPGLGALTYELLGRVKHLYVVELDRNLAARLEQSTRTHSNITIICEDALTTEFCQLSQNKKIRLIGNLPYNISTPLLFHILEQRACITDMCFMLQREVGERILAQPGSKQYGRLSIMLQQSCRVEKVLYVGSGAFSPPPKVESIVLSILPLEHPPHQVNNFDAFEKVVRVAFSQRRKTLRNALMPLITDSAMSKLGIDPKLRPEQLPIGDYVKLSQLL